MSERRDGALLGLYEEPEGAARALDALRAAGFAAPDVRVLSDVPYPEGAFGEEPERSRIHLFALAGAGMGFALGLLLTVGTQLSYPLVTGGKPLLSIPPMINVLFEATMFGTILAVVLGILFESRLPDLQQAPYDRRVDAGYLGVLVTAAGGRLDSVERALRAAGAVDVVAPDHEDGERQQVQTGTGAAGTSRETTVGKQETPDDEGRRRDA